MTKEVLMELFDLGASWVYLLIIAVMTGAMILVSVATFARPEHIAVTVAVLLGTLAVEAVYFSKRWRRINDRNRAPKLCGNVALIVADVLRNDHFYDFLPTEGVNLAKWEQEHKEWRQLREIPLIVVNHWVKFESPVYQTASVIKLFAALDKTTVYVRPEIRGNNYQLAGRQEGKNIEVVGPPVVSPARFAALIRHELSHRCLEVLGYDPGPGGDKHHAIMQQRGEP